MIKKLVVTLSGDRIATITPGRGALYAADPAPGGGSGFAFEPSELMCLNALLTATAAFATLFEGFDAVGRNDPDFTPEQWQQEVGAGNTRLGYDDWVYDRKQEEIAKEREAADAGFDDDPDGDDD